VSNTRVFAWGWVANMGALGLADWLGYGQSGLLGLVWKSVLALSIGMTAVALFGDRPTPASKGEAE